MRGEESWILEERKMRMKDERRRKIGTEDRDEKERKQCTRRKERAKER